MNRSTAIALLLLLGSVAFAATLTTAEGQATAPADNEFAGMIMTVYLQDTAEDSGLVLENASLKEIGGRLMLVGTGADTGHAENWTSGARAGVPWDAVSMYVLMTPEQFEGTLAEQRF